MNLRHAGFHRVVEQMLQARFADMAERSAGAAVHVEANSYLRYEARWLRDHLDARLVHVVRDGRTYVRSAYVRDVYTSADQQLPIVPRDDDPDAVRWSTWGRFEKICWYWNHSNAMLADGVSPCVKMEALFSDYAVLQERVLETFGVKVSEADWRRLVTRPVNSRKRYVVRRQIRRLLHRGPARGPMQPLDPYETWPDHQKETFWSICGNTMKRLGYA